MVSRRARGVASISLLSALLAGYGVIVYNNDSEQYDEDNFLEYEEAQVRRALGLQEEDLTLKTSNKNNGPHRVLAKNGDSPESMHEVDGEYVLKPWVGSAMTEIRESYIDTLLALDSAQSSSERGIDFVPKNAVNSNLLDNWSSSLTRPESVEWLQIDMGGPQAVQEIYIKWDEAYAASYTLQVATERVNCRPNGRSCPNSWTTIKTVTGKSNSDPTMDVFGRSTTDVADVPQGVRYARILLNQRAPGHNNFSIYYVKIYREKMITDYEPTATSCGATLADATSNLISKYNSFSAITYYDTSGFVLISEPSNRWQLRSDPCVFTVEPNYVLESRSARLGVPPEEEPHHRRRLAIPEFNLRDDAPANWGLERISSMGGRNGKYIWFHEGVDGHIYTFDTGVYPDSYEWQNYDGSVDRFAEGVVCTGGATDYQYTNHGTHVASIAMGLKTGTAKSSLIHPMQVLDRYGKGSTKTFLCALEKMLQDGIAWNAANAPKKYRGIVNLSLGVNGHSDALDHAVSLLTDSGYTVTIAAGNNDGNACFYSPYHPSAITVGALRDDTSRSKGENDKTSNSNYGPCIDVWAPGENVLGAANTGEFDRASLSGTSVASAFVAGTAALFFEQINTKNYSPLELSPLVKEFLINKAEINALGNIGYGSHNKMLQTTVSKCEINSHCEKGLTCISDGTCRDLKKPLNKRLKKS